MCCGHHRCINKYVDVLRAIDDRVHTVSAIIYGPDICRRTVRRRDSCVQNTEESQETIAKYAVDANLFGLGPPILKKHSATSCFLMSLRQTLPRQTVPRQKVRDHTQGIDPRH